MIKRVDRRAIILAFALIVALALFSRNVISPIDMIGGKERTVAKQILPNGEELRVIQYWNHGDFYNLELRHRTKEGLTLWCVIDPDCLRIPRCELRIDQVRGELVITLGGTLWGRYRWEKREFLKSNGVLMPCDR